jgi:hypothetical protein
MAQIIDYSSLQANVADFLHRADLTGVIPTFIQEAEQRMNTDVVARDMEIIAPLTTVSGNPLLAMPTDVTETRRLTVSSTDPIRVLKYMAAEQLALKYPSSRVGTPEVYTVTGGNFQFGPIPDAAYTLSYMYRQRLTALTGAAPTNWLILKWPLAYLYGSLCAAAPYLGNDVRIKTWEEKYKQMVDGINSVDWFSGGTMAVQAV